MWKRILPVVLTIVSVTSCGTANAEPLGPEPGRIGSGWSVSAVVHPCEATRTEAVSRLPMDYGTSYEWDDLDNAAGSYRVGENLIRLDVDLECKWVPHVVTHEWMHQLQDLSGSFDPAKVNGYLMGEIVAECAARLFSDIQGWPYYDSYPELSNTSCATVSSDVDELLSLI